MGFLKKFGSVLAQVALSAAGFAPLIKQMTPARVDAGIDRGLGVLDQVVAAVQATEVAGQAWSQPGPERAKVAGALSAQAFVTWVKASGHEVDDEAKFLTSIQTISGGVADMLSSLKAKG